MLPLSDYVHVTTAQNHWVALTLLVAAVIVHGDNSFMIVLRFLLGGTGRNKILSFSHCQVATVSYTYISFSLWLPVSQSLEFHGYWNSNLSVGDLAVFALADVIYCVMFGWGLYKTTAVIGVLWWHTCDMHDFTNVMAMRYYVMGMRYYVTELGIILL